VLPAARGHRVVHALAQPKLVSFFKIGSESLLSLISLAISSSAAQLRSPSIMFLFLFLFSLITS
jgi:hypothetical protein